MAHELHLVQGLVDRHGLRLVQLLADDDGRIAQLVFDLLAGDSRDLGRLLGRLLLGLGNVDVLRRQRQRRTHVGVGASVFLAAITRAPQPLEKLSRRQVEGPVPIGRGCLGAYDRALVDDGYLYSLGDFRLGGIGLVGYLDVDPLRPRRELFDLRELLVDVGAETVGNFGVSTFDDNLHNALLGDVILMELALHLTQSQRRSPPFPETAAPSGRSRRCLHCNRPRASGRGLNHICLSISWVGRRCEDDGADHPCTGLFERTRTSGQCRAGCEDVVGHHAI